MVVRISANTKAVVWDLDGTLIDSIGIFEEVIHEIAPLIHKPAPSRKVIAENYHGSLRDTIHAVLGGGIENHVLDELERTFIVKQEAHYESVDGHLLDDAVGLAIRIRGVGIRQVVVTNRGHVGRGKASPRYIIENSSLQEHVEHIICREETEYAKPDPRVLESYLEQASLTGKQVIVIGDQFVDAQLALGLEAQAILVERHGRIPHLDRLGKDWEKHIRVVGSLHNVKVS